MEGSITVYSRLSKQIEDLTCVMERIVVDRSLLIDWEGCPEEATATVVHGNCGEVLNLKDLRKSSAA